MLNRGGIFLAVVIGATLGLAGQAAHGLDASGVLVIYNSASTAGQQIADHYAQVHPGVRLAAIDNVPVAEVVNESVYLDQIRPQVLAAMDDSVDCIVTTKGLPLRIVNNHPGSHLIVNTYSSLESELTRVDTIDSADLMGNQMPPMPSIPPALTNPLMMNPYGGAAGAFDHNVYGTRLTARLDGFTVSDVIAGIDRAQRVQYGNASFVVDDDPDLSYDRMDLLANDVLAQAGVNYQYDNTDAFLSTAAGDAIGYVSHGTHGGAPQGYILDRDNGLQFATAPGAIFDTWESFNAYSFEEGGNRLGQGLIAEWIHRGGTAGVGTVEEPGASGIGVTDEARLFDLMLNGYTWAEAAWNATVQLSYVNTVVGDPLMRWSEQLAPADANGDGEVDTDDLDLVLSNWGRSTWAGDALHGDLSGDGWVGMTDLDVFLDGFNSGLIEQSSRYIPEPCSLGLLVLGSVGLVRRKRA